MGSNKAHILQDRLTSSKVIPDLAEAVEEQSEAARGDHMHNHIGDILDCEKNFWKEMQNSGLIPKATRSEKIWVG